MKNFLAAIVVLLSLTAVAHAEVQSYTGTGEVLLVSEDMSDRLKQNVLPKLMSPEKAYEFSQEIAEKRKQDEAERTFKYVAIIVGILVVVGAGIFFFRPAFRSFGKSADLTRMIQKYSGDCMNPQVVPEIYLYCCNNEMLSPIVRKHGATFNDFAAVYILLISSCNVGGKGHFIPISAFFFASSLDYVLSHKNAWYTEDSLWLMKYFGLLS